MPETHQHKISETSELYEFCECGATRRKDRVGMPKDDWHVCELCRVKVLDPNRKGD